MSNPDNGGERSMSDILASIRKIMSQEPAAGSPPPPANGARTELIERARAGATEPKLPEPQPSVPKVEVKAEPKLPQPKPTEPKVEAKPEPKLPEPKPAVKAAAGPVRAEVPPPDDAVSIDEFIAMAAPVAAGPGPGLRAKADVDSAAGPVQPKSSTPAAARPAQTAETAAGPRHAPSTGGDLGRVVPGRLGENAGPAAGPPPAPATDSVEIPGADALRRLLAGVIPPSAHPGLPPLPQPDEKPADAVAPASKPVEAPPAPKPTPQPGAQTAPQPAKASPPPATSSAPAPALAPKPAPAAGAAAPPPAAPQAAKPETPAPAAAAAPKPATPQPSAAPQPTAKVAAPPSSAPQPVASPAPAAPAQADKPATGQTMEEAVVGMLRPLLREWLDKNMPRLIEPALKAELEALRADAANKKT